MASVAMVCSGCERSYSPDEPIWDCPRCGSTLEIRQDLSEIPADDRSTLFAGPCLPGKGLWRYAPLIPVGAATPVSMGEGDTPLVMLRRLGRELGLQKLYAKLEYFSPTGSFKDRGTTVVVTKARQLGVSRLVEDSSGNAGASFSAYCAQAGISASIYVPASAPQAKKAQIAFYGAETVPVSGSREDVTEAAFRRCQDERAYYGSHNVNPWFLQGTKTLAYEIAEQFSFDPPEHLVMPVANGSLFLGAAIGFRELMELGIIERSPRLHVAQAGACMPIVDAYRRGLEQTEVIPTRPTVAGGISIAKPSRGAMILRAMRESDGAGAAVSDEEILHVQRRLACLEGIFCEPTSATAFAVLPELIHAGTIDPAERVLVAVTGMGLKDTSVFS